MRIKLESPLGVIPDAEVVKRLHKYFMEGSSYVSDQATTLPEPVEMKVEAVLECGTKVLCNWMMSFDEKKVREGANTILNADLPLDTDNSIGTWRDLHKARNVIRKRHGIPLRETFDHFGWIKDAEAKERVIKMYEAY